MDLENSQDLARLGEVIRQNRRDKCIGLAGLAEFAGIDKTYLSKIENGKNDYEPKEDVIQSLAIALELDPEPLIFLSGRVPEKYRALLTEHSQEMATLFQAMQDDVFRDRVFSLARAVEQEEQEYYYYAGFSGEKEGQWEDL